MVCARSCYLPFTYGAIKHQTVSVLGTFRTHTFKFFSTFLFPELCFLNSIKTKIALIHIFRQLHRMKKKI